LETGNLTLSVLNGEKIGSGQELNRIAIALHVDDVATARATLEKRRSRATSSTRASATWRSSAIRTAMR
jgi:hypothetical protein